MTARQLTDRFIEDIRKSIQISEQIDNLKAAAMPMPDDIRKIRSFLAEDSTLKFYKNLDNIAQLINNGLVTRKQGEKLDIQEFLNDLYLNKEKIIGRIQEILNGTYGSSIPKLLIEQFEWIHKS